MMKETSANLAFPLPLLPLFYLLPVSPFFLFFSLFSVPPFSFLVFFSSSPFFCRLCLSLSLPLLSLFFLNCFNHILLFPLSPLPFPFLFLFTSVLRCRVCCLGCIGASDCKFLAAQCVFCAAAPQILTLRGVAELRK